MNKVVHFEIPVDDLGSTDFYSDVFGWQLQPFPDMKYVIVNTVATGDDQLPTEAGAINGGLMERSADLTGPVLMVSVASAAEHLEKVQAAGGSVVRPATEIPGMGWYAYFRDPSGNVLGLWQDASG